MNIVEMVKNAKPGDFIICTKNVIDNVIFEAEIRETWPEYLNRVCDELYKKEQESQKVGGK